MFPQFLQIRNQPPSSLLIVQNPLGLFFSRVETVWKRSTRLEMTAAMTALGIDAKAGWLLINA
jgi:hypothetical protein